MKIEFIRHIFCTLTYAPNYCKPWDRVSKDYNRYIQEFRRETNCSVGYLRVIERHKNGRPHIHALLQFPDARIRVCNRSYFDNSFYHRWRALWRYGHSDYQRPYSNRSPVGYILKYITKNATSKTVWKKILQDQPSLDTSEESNVEMEPPLTKKSTDTKIPSSTHLNGLKLLTWSRNFDFTPFKPVSLVAPQTASKAEKSLLQVHTK